MATSIALPAAKPRPYHALVLDAGPILSSAAAPTFYLTTADKIYTTPSVITEIRDEAARSRFETLWKPFLNVRSPRVDSLKHVAEFSKKTGDYAVLSKTDLGLVALGYELECEIAGGEWRLRKVPGQKELNGPLPEGWEWEGRPLKEGKTISGIQETNAETRDETKEEVKEETTAGSGEKVAEKITKEESTSETETTPAEKFVQEATESVNIAEKLEEVQLETQEDISVQPEKVAEEDSEDSDSEGWITPSNIHKHKEREMASTTAEEGTHKHTVALATADFALQNVLLHLNLNLLSPISLQRIKATRSTVLRCHACFFIIRHPSTRTTTDFCPRCGGLKTLLRTSCSTDEHGVFRIHLKRNFQWNNRGNVFSLPKTRHGTSSMKGVPDAPVLREDQKEYQRAVKWEGYRKEKDLFDQDNLPNILTGERRRGSTIRTGTGRRNPNETRRGGGKRKK